jgi:hypothetical protein
MGAAAFAASRDYTGFAETPGSCSDSAGHRRVAGAEVLWKSRVVRQATGYERTGIIRTNSIVAGC